MADSANDLPPARSFKRTVIGLLALALGAAAGSLVVGYLLDKPATVPGHGLLELAKGSPQLALELRDLSVPLIHDNRAYRQQVVHVTVSFTSRDGRRRAEKEVARLRNAFTLALSTLPQSVRGEELLTLDYPALTNELQRVSDEVLGPGTTTGIGIEPGIIRHF
ncbi:MAG: hypothetical protein RIE31_10175 [Alphaproteobacteria bacterium]